MNQNLTELVFILDRSGSMSGLETDTIGGFNSMLEKQKKEEGEAYVSTILFDHEQEVLHDRLPIGKIDPLTAEDYFVRGSTALIDALGNAIRHIGNIHKYAREEDVPARTLFVITTDGMENASHIFTSKQVKKMVEEKKKAGWDFLFLGANIDAVETGKTYGIAPEFSVNFHSDSVGTAVNYCAVNEAVSAVRGKKKLSAAWKKDIEEDFESRV